MCLAYLKIKYCVLANFFDNVMQESLSGHNNLPQIIIININMHYMHFPWLILSHFVIIYITNLERGKGILILSAFSFKND
jgi:hypothetical protein